MEWGLLYEIEIRCTLNKGLEVEVPLCFTSKGCEDSLLDQERFYKVKLKVYEWNQSGV